MSESTLGQLLGRTKKASLKLLFTLSLRDKSKRKKIGGSLIQEHKGERQARVSLFASYIKSTEAGEFSATHVLQESTTAFQIPPDILAVARAPVRLG